MDLSQRQMSVLVNCAWAERCDKLAELNPGPNEWHPRHGGSVMGLLLADPRVQAALEDAFADSARILGEDTARHFREEAARARAHAADLEQRAQAALALEVA